MKEISWETPTEFKNGNRRQNKNRVSEFPSPQKKKKKKMYTLIFAKAFRKFTEINNRNEYNKVMGNTLQLPQQLCELKVTYNTAVCQVSM